MEWLGVKLEKLDLLEFISMEEGPETPARKGLFREETRQSAKFIILGADKFKNMCYTNKDYTFARKGMSLWNIGVVT